MISVSAPLNAPLPVFDTSAFRNRPGWSCRR
jgi:hypothetical protein